MIPKFVFYDYETFNLTPHGGHASQFAAVITDDNFNVLETYDFYCAPSYDVIPEVSACLVTTHTPFFIKNNNEIEVMNEWDFTHKIHSIMTKYHGLCVAGYNSKKFDDEWTRVLFYRNFIDPYSWSYKNGNSRFDVIDLISDVAAFSPDSLKWEYVDVVDESGLVTGRRKSFRQEKLCLANNIEHEKAHDALSDVSGLVLLTKLVRDKCPSLFKNALLRTNKSVCNNIIESNEMVVSSTSYSKDGDFKENLIYLLSRSDKHYYFNVDVDPGIFLNMSDDEFFEYLQLSSKEKESLGLPKFSGIVAIKANAAPRIHPIDTIKEYGLDWPSGCTRARMSANYKVVKRNKDALVLKASVLASKEFPAPKDDTDLTLYSDGFIQPPDKVLHQRFSELDWSGRFEFFQTQPESKIKSMMFKIIGRNAFDVFPEDYKSMWVSYVMDRYNGVALNCPTNKDGTVVSGMSELKKAKIICSDNNALNHDHHIASDLMKHFNEMSTL